MPGPIPFGRYVLLDKIAVGGMAEIFLAKAVGEAGFEKTCVIKRVLPHLASTPGFVELFLAEAHTVARLNHPGIVQVFDLGRQGDDYFLAMEYLAGEDLAAVMRRTVELGREMPVDVAARIACSTAEALHAAHELADERGRPLGLVHRDVSPSNLFVTYQGAVKVLDFGIAHLEREGGATGAAVGKAAYVPPEQAQRKPVDRRADVWSLGVCLHEMLAGRRLFAGGSLEETRKAVLEAPIESPRAHRPELPAELEDVVMRALRRAPQERFPTADAMRAALDGYLADRTYVAQTLQLAHFLRDLFGSDRADARMRRTAAPALAAEPVTATEILPDAGASAAPAIRPAAPAPVAGKRRRGPLIGLLGLALASSAAAAWWRLESPPAPVTASGPPASSRIDAGAPPVAEKAPPGSAMPTAVAPVVERPSRPLDGYLTVEANLPVSVRLDSKAMGQTPVRRTRLPARSYRLELRNAELGIARTQTVRLEAGQESSVRVSFGKGRVNVMASPWADVWLDGVKIGQTPLAGREVWEGRHAVRLVGPNGEKTVSIDVTAGKTTVVRETLTAAGPPR